MDETQTATDHSEKSILYSENLFETAFSTSGFADFETAFSTSGSADEVKVEGGDAENLFETAFSTSGFADFETAFSTSGSADEVKVQGGDAATTKEVDAEKSIVDSGSVLETAMTSTRSLSADEVEVEGDKNAATKKEVVSGSILEETAFSTSGSADEVKVQGGDAATTKEVDAEKGIVDSGSVLETAMTTRSSFADEVEVEGGNAATKKGVDSGSILETATTTRSSSADEEVKVEGGDAATKKEVDSGSLLETATRTRSSSSADEVEVEGGTAASKEEVDAEKSIIYSASIVEETATTTSSSSADEVEVEGGNAATKKEVKFDFSGKSIIDSGSILDTATATTSGSSSGGEGGTAATKEEVEAPLAWLRRRSRWVSDAHENLHTSSWLSCGTSIGDAFPSASTCGFGKAETTMRAKEALKLAGTSRKLKELLMWPVDFDELSFQDTDDEEWYFSGSYDRGSNLSDGEIDQKEFVKGIDGIYTALEEEGEIKPCINKPPELNTPIPQLMYQKGNICYDEGTISKTESVILDKPPEPNDYTAQLLMYQKDFVLGNIRRMRTIAGLDNSKNHKAYVSKITTAALHHSRTTDSALQAPPHQHPPVGVCNYMHGNLESPCAEKIELQLVRDNHNNNKKKVVLEQQQQRNTKKQPWWRHRSVRA